MRHVRFTVPCVVVALLACGAYALAAPATRPAKPREVRLVQPWSKVKDLSDDQKSRIASIHTEIVDKMRALREEEERRCNDVLTETQRRQLEATLAAESAQRKLDDAERRKAELDGRATTKPAG